MNFRKHVQTFTMAALLAAALSTSAARIRPAAAEPVQWTGPNGPQCHLRDWTGDTTINPQGNDGWGSVSSITTAPIHAAGCSVVPPKQLPGAKP